jgi:hypothetical protein
MTIHGNEFSGAGGVVNLVAGDAVGAKFSFQAGGSEKFVVEGSGITCKDTINVESGHTYQFNGTDVVGPRVTGWTAWTGTATRTSVATGSATVQNCAEAIKALVDDLIAHGLIGT